ncbi:hypothetical protein [Streptomyces misionensis]|uniref:hypothetical protein n=1 Tax=Streptomyces misionensis TaxID=67331 RepID=UPI0033EEBDDC
MVETQPREVVETQPREVVETPPQNETNVIETNVIETKIGFGALRRVAPLNAGGHLQVVARERA